MLGGVAMAQAVVGIPDSLCVANAKPSSGERVLACGLFTHDIQQSLPTSPCFHFAINQSHSLAVVRLSATILRIRSESNICRQRFGMPSSTCVKINHRAP